MSDLDRNIENMLNTARIPFITSPAPKVIPEAVADFARLFAEASKVGLKLALRGLCTQGSVAAGRLEVSALKLNEVEEGSEGDLTIEVGAGLPFNELRKLTSEMAVEWGEYSGTVGGCLCGRRDNEAHRRLASRVMGMTYVRPTGEIVELGSRSVKDVAGYHLTPLLIGSRGRIGLAAKVIINTAPIFREYSFSSVVAENGADSIQSGRKMSERLISTLDPGGIFG